jgi:hypothetical protein
MFRLHGGPKRETLAPMTAQTWHYGVIARWWAEFNTSGPEIDYFRRHVEAGQPARSPLRHRQAAASVPPRRPRRRRLRRLR